MLDSQILSYVLEGHRLHFSSSTPPIVQTIAYPALDHIYIHSQLIHKDLDVGIWTPPNAPLSMKFSIYWTITYRVPTLHDIATLHGST